jgi:hypothetical protein
MKAFLFLLLLIRAVLPLPGERLSIPGREMSIDLPESYVLTSNNGKTRFSFSDPGGSHFDLVIYDGEYQSLNSLISETNRRLGNSGDTDFFLYNGKNAAMLSLDFTLNGKKMAGFCLAILLQESNAGVKNTMLSALAYAPAGARGAAPSYLSALDSIAPSEAERRYPGPVTEYAFPRGEKRLIKLAKEGVFAFMYEHDADAAQAVIDREFLLLRDYLNRENWQKAWIRFYRVIYRDSWDRLADAAFRLERSWNSGGEDAGLLPLQGRQPEHSALQRTFAQKALDWVQGFKYERDLMGSDFVNLVSAVTEGRGDCDSRAMLWAMILAQANIPAAMMVSRGYSHAMGLAGVSGEGARFEAGGVNWLVAETTAAVGIGLIGQDVSRTEEWLGVIFE